MTAEKNFHRVLALPANPEPENFYLEKTATGFKLYVTDANSVPIPLDSIKIHNSTTEKQGGDGVNFFHLGLEDYNKVVALPAPSTQTTALWNHSYRDTSGDLGFAGLTTYNGNAYAVSRKANTLYTSTNEGQSWTESTISLGRVGAINNLRRVNNKNFLLRWNVNTNGGVDEYTDNFSSFVSLAIDYEVFNVAFGNNMYVFASGRHGAGAAGGIAAQTLLTSTDLITFSTVRPDYQMRGVVRGPDRFIAVGMSTEDVFGAGGGDIATLVDGNPNWVFSSSPDPDINFNFTGFDMWQDIDYSPTLNMYMAVRGKNSSVMTSINNGSTWQLKNPGFISTNVRWDSVLGAFLCITTAGVQVSYDGDTWQLEAYGASVNQGGTINDILIQRTARVNNTQLGITRFNLVKRETETIIINPVEPNNGQSKVFIEEEFVYLSGNSNSFTLNKTPNTVMYVYINGRKLKRDLDWTLSGNIVTIISILENLNEIDIVYY